MANRVLLGNRTTGGYGLYVSKNGDNVLDTTNALAFDPRMGASMIVHSYGQGSITGGGADHTITHNLGYEPTVAIRWSNPEDISSGVATKAYNPAEQTMNWEEEEEDEAVADGEAQWGMAWNHVNTSSFRIQNKSDAQGDNSSLTKRTLYYAYVIFHQTNLGIEL